jgi:membrane associated rhomboid family serine protease
MRRHLGELDQHMSAWFTPAVKWLIYLCVGTFLCQLVFSAFFRPGTIEYWFAASPATTLYRFRLWQLVTYAFLHGSPMHLLLNMLGLWFFGTRLEEYWRTERFVKFVIFTAAGSVLLHLLIATALYMHNTPLSQMYFFIIGISGVCYAIMFAFAWYWPDTPIYIYAIFPVKARVLVIIMAVLILLGSVQGGSQIAHFTHLGGFLFGYLFVKFQSFFDRIPVPRLPRRKRGPQFNERGRWRDF